MTHAVSGPISPSYRRGMVFVAQMTPGASVHGVNEVTEMLEENEAVACGDTPQADAKIALHVKVDCAEARVFELDKGAGATGILEAVAAERGCGIEELVLVREGEDEPLVVDVAVDVGDPDKGPLHIHYPGEVKVTVFYQERHDIHEFKRFEAIKDVLAWAIEAFKIDSSLATELVLVRHGQKDELPEREHIGHLAGKDGELALDLVRGDIANGSSA